MSWTDRRPAVAIGDIAYRAYVTNKSVVTISNKQNLKKSQRLNCDITQCRNVLVPKCPGAEVSVKRMTAVTAICQSRYERTRELVVSTEHMSKQHLLCRELVCPYLPNISSDLIAKVWLAVGFVRASTLHYCEFLADRTNGRYWYSVASVCRLSSSVCTECIVAKRCILEQKLVLRAYRKSYIRNQLVPKWMTLAFI